MKVLFICKFNAGRSRMAEAFFNKLSRKNSASSAGIGRYPTSSSSPKGVRATVEVMKELGIRVPYKLGRAVTRKDVDEADKVVVMLDRKQQRILPRYITGSGKTTYYEIPDSDGRMSDFMDQHRRNRDAVRRIVMNLVREMG